MEHWPEMGYFIFLVNNSLDNSLKHTKKYLCNEDCIFTTKYYFINLLFICTFKTILTRTLARFDCSNNSRQTFCFASWPPTIPRVFVHIAPSFHSK